MRVTPRTKEEAERLSDRSVLRAGWHPARITEASETRTRTNKEMVELWLTIRDDKGQERTFRDWLVDNDLCSARLRNCIEAIGAMEKYNAGSIKAADFAGRNVQVKLDILKKRGQPDRNTIINYGAAS